MQDIRYLGVKLILYQLKIFKCCIEENPNQKLLTSHNALLVLISDVNRFFLSLFFFKTTFFLYKKNIAKKLVFF